jgi:hypothetical protein
MSRLLAVIASLDGRERCFCPSGDVSAAGRPQREGEADDEVADGSSGRRPYWPSCRGPIPPAIADGTLARIPLPVIGLSDCALRPWMPADAPGLHRLEASRSTHGTGTDAVTDRAGTRSCSPTIT